ncbi:MAG: GNAT family N-acetyltransferase [Candidatus Accumulibacter sp.]|jgi:GNAT superfamily N-acetyltransferase|nr:GNAT family N-acetyltransferase [Accumulibacter sp.]
MEIVAVTDDRGGVAEARWLEKAERVHRQLRPQLPADSGYAARLREIFAAGARMALAVEDGAVVSVALWRVVENTHEGRRLYVDDLVSDAASRSRGAGRLLLAWLEARARSLGCGVLALDSGVQRQDAHRFYFREGMAISSFCFKKRLK